MPEEILAIVIISIVMGTIISLTKTVLGYRERRYGSSDSEPKKERSKSKGASMTTSELQDMLRETVEEATAPLADRLSALERRSTKMLEAARKPDFEDAVSVEEPIPVKKTRA